MRNDKLKNTHFQKKLFTGISLIMVLCILLVSLLFSHTATKNQVETERISNQILLERISSQVDLLYEQMNIAATSITKNPTLKQILINLNTSTPEQSEEYIEILQQERTIHTLLGNMMFSPSISNVLLYNKEKPYFYYVGTYLDDSNHIQNTLNRSTAAEKLKEQMPIYSGPGQSPWITSEKTVISVMRSFSDNTTTQDSIVEIQVPATFLDSICTQSTFHDEKEILILDADGNLIYPYASSPKVLKNTKIKKIKQQISDGTAASYNLNYSYLSAHSSETGYTTILVSNNASLRQQIFFFLLISLAAAAVFLIVILFIVNRVLSTVTKPLNHLIEYVEQISLDEDNKLELPANSLDEFEILNTSLSQMVSNLKTSMQEIYELQLRESNASLAALQAQIDPHFMYNALNSISAASEIYGSEMTTLMCQQFSSMMHYVTSSKQVVTLADELRHTENYLKFMSLSNEDNFHYTLDIAPELNQLIIPKLSIQPLVENCFKHAFSKVAPPWHISISCHVTADDYWEISIEDNGCGFTQEALEHLSSLPLSFNTLEINGLGLNNTFSRFSLHLHGDFSYKIENLTPGSRIILKGELQK